MSVLTERSLSARGGGSADESAPDRPAAGQGALARALDRWRRAVSARVPLPAPSIGPGSESAASGAVASGATGAAPAGEPVGLIELTRRLDDAGCSYGRVSAARLDYLTRAYDRLETKLNAVLMAVMGTFLSTLASLFLYYARGGTH